MFWRLCAGHLVCAGFLESRSTYLCHSRHLFIVDASKYDFSRLATFENGELVINTDYANVIGLRRYKEKGKGFYFSPKLIEWLGPKREGDIADEPYIHYAASMQALFEKLALQMIDHYLGDVLKQTGKLAFAGGCALNVKLNQKIIARPDVKELFVQLRPATPVRRWARRPMCPMPAVCPWRRWSTGTWDRPTPTRT